MRSRLHVTLHSRITESKEPRGKAESQFALFQRQQYPMPVHLLVVGLFLIVCNTTVHPFFIQKSRDLSFTLEMDLVYTSLYNCGTPDTCEWLFLSASQAKEMGEEGNEGISRANSVV